MLSMTSTNGMDEDRRFVATPINTDYAEDSVSPFSSSEESMLDEHDEIKPSVSYHVISVTEASLSHLFNASPHRQISS